MKLLNSKVYEGKKYELEDVRGFIPIEKKGIPDGFYGGRVKQLARTEIQGVYLCMDDMEVIDIITFEDELEIEFSDIPESITTQISDDNGNTSTVTVDAQGIQVQIISDNKEESEIPFTDDIDYTQYTNAELKKILEESGIEFSPKANKAELIELITQGDK